MAVPAQAARLNVSAGDPALTYVQARAADISGDHQRSAALLAALAQMEPANLALSRQALAEAIGAGQMDLALRLAAAIPADKLIPDGRLLLVADELKRGRSDQALPWLTVKGKRGDLAFLAPLVTAWGAADSGDLNRAITAMQSVQANSVMGSFRDEQTALILLKFKRAAQAEPFARRAIGSAGTRETRLRLALADGFLGAGDKARAVAMVEGISGDAAAARQKILSGKRSGEGIDSGAEALSEVLTAFAGDVARMQRTAAPIGLVQVARYADPGNSGAAVLLALLRNQQGETADALAILQSIPADDPLIGAARDVQAKILTDEKRFNEAYAVAATAAAAPDAGAGDYSRLGDVLEAMDRHPQAAEAYGRAAAMMKARGANDNLWPLLLLQAGSLEQANQWPEARARLQQALAIAPNEPLLLNFMGYAELERGENMDAAEAMIRKASQLAPDDASITDSLGWAEFKRGKVDDAIATLQKAAEKDPDQAEIQEHLGDALYKSGRRYEARFAWHAALVTAEDEIAARVKAKLQSGMTATNAAP